MPDDKEQQKSDFDEAYVGYTPTEVATYGLQAVEDVQKNAHRAIDSGVEGLTGYLAPLRPGQVIGIVGQTSHYKSGLLHLIEHNVTDILKKNGRDDEVVIHISVEEGVEEQSFLEFARVSGIPAGRMANGEVEDWETLRKSAYKVAKLPIYRIGDSLVRSEYIPKLYLTNIIQAIRWLCREYKVRPAMIGLDYLQALPIDPELKKYDIDNQRRLQVRSDAYRVREIASAFQCSVWVACQAKQTLQQWNQNSGPTMLIPSMYDINESSDVAQRFDRLLGVWLPARSYPVGTRIRVGPTEIEVTNSLFFVKVNKQRGGYPAGRVFAYDIDYTHNRLIPHRLEGFGDFGDVA